MNVVFGAAVRPGSGERYAGLAQAAEALFGTAPEVLAQKPGSGVSLGCLTNGGAIVGRCAEGDAALAYIGAPNKPLPDWPADASPIDDPDATARYLLQRFRTKGTDFLNGITGAYAVAVHDGANGRLLLAADPGGGRVLFVHEDGGNLAFGTHLFALARGLGEAAAVDRSYEDFFLVHGFFPFNRTPVANVRYLRPGEILEWRADGTTTHTIREGDPWAARYGNLDFTGMSEADVVDLLHEAFMAAMSEQLASADEAAVLLGGFDSALVAAALHRLGKRVETFSFYYGEDKYNQPHTDTLAKYLGIKHNWIPITPEVIEDGIRNYEKRFNFATNWINYPIQTEYLCREMQRRGFRYCYSGDGCDAVFLGYPRVHFVSKNLSRVHKLPAPLLRAGIAALDWGAVERGIGRPYRVLLSLLRSAGMDMPERGYLTFRVFDETSLRRLRADAPPQQAEPIAATLARMAESLGGLSRDRVAYLGKAAISPNKSKMIGSSDSTGLAISAPYLHPGLKQLATRIPDSFSRPGDRTESYVTGKYTLMKMAEKNGLLPREIIYQKKLSAVDAPMDYWYYGPLKAVVRERLGRLPFKADARFVESLLKPKWAETFYRDKISSDNLTSHELSLLVSYASLAGFR